MITELNLGIITGKQKRLLERYVDKDLFRQRKSYDEYYVNADFLGTSFTINELMILAEEFDVSVERSGITLGNKR